MTPTKEDELRSLVTPSLLSTIAEANMPFSKTAFLDFAYVADSGPHFQKVCKASTARAALLAFARLGPPGTVPELDLLSLLPPPSSPAFPQQCYGLQLLLDQVSRFVFGGVDCRWQCAFFTPLARRLAGQWLALPEAQRPDSWARWRDDVRCSFQYWIASRAMWAAPFLHAEDLDSQWIGLALAQETRAAVEKHACEVDPYGEDRDALLKDDLAFARELPKGVPRRELGGPPVGEEASMSMSGWAFWWCMIIDSHWPIMERFGRYPYRNAALGRESTPEEKKWLEDIGDFAAVPPDVAARIRRDVEEGKWTALGEE